MSDPMISTDGFHGLTARLATLDLDPPTLEMLTAVLTIDLDDDGDVNGEATREHVVTT